MSLWIEPGGTEDFVLEGVTFKIRKLTAREQLAIASNSGDMLGAVAAGVAGWEGEGAPTPAFDANGHLSVVTLDLMRLQTIAALAEKILDVNQMSDTDRGNSPSSSQPDSERQDEPDV